MQEAENGTPEFFRGKTNAFAPIKHHLKVVQRKTLSVVYVDGKLTWRCSDKKSADSIAQHLRGIGWAH